MLSLLVKFAAAAHVATEAPEWMQALVPQAAAAQVRGPHVLALRGGAKDAEVNEEPRFGLKTSVQPKLKLRKKTSVLGTELKFGVDYDVKTKKAVPELTWRDNFVGGDLSLQGTDKVQWKKKWSLPGVVPSKLLPDASTVEVTSCVDLHSLKPDVQVKLGLLANPKKRGLALRRGITIDGEAGHFQLNTGVALQIPEDISLSPGDLRDPTRFFNRLFATADLDQLELCVEY